MLEIHTDGSCRPNPGPGGWGWVAVRNDEEIDCDSGHHPDTTNNRMELTAFRQALQWLSLREDRVAIYVDSQYVNKGLTQWIHKWKRNGWKSQNGPVKNKDLWVQVDALYDTMKDRIEIHWERGHFGHRWNERADELAGDWSNHV